MLVCLRLPNGKHVLMVACVCLVGIFVSSTFNLISILELFILVLIAGVSVVMLMVMTIRIHHLKKSSMLVAVIIRIFVCLNHLLSLLIWVAVPMVNQMV